MRSDAPSCPDDLLEPLPPIDTGTHGLVLLPEMEPTLRALERAIMAAERRVHIECYIVKDDAFGQLLAKLLIPVARRGVECKLLCDALGSEEADPAFFKELRRHNIDARIYRGKPSMIRGVPFPRDHGRVFVIDDRALTGGLAFREEWLPKRRGGKGWHDVSIEIAWGPVVEDFERVFQTRWREAFGDEDICDVETGHKYADLELVADCPKHATLVYEHYRRRIVKARSRIWIENSYFFPPPAMLQELVDAARRGVDVRVMMPVESDLPIIANAARAEYPRWIEHGIRVFEYGRCMNHAKIAVIDDDWCTVGTFNANPTSMGLANEVNVFVFDRRFVALMAEHFQRDLEHCTEVDADEIRARPLLQQVRDQLQADVLNLGDVVFGPHDGPRDLDRPSHPAAEDEACRSSRS